MTVSVAMTLPAQPATGQTRLVALPGDGRVSPFSRWDVFVQIVGDASGGFSRIVINMDPTYVSLVDYALCFINGAAGNSAFVMQLFNSSFEKAEKRGEGSFSDVTSISASVSAQWYPPSIPLLQVPGSDSVPNLTCIMENPGVGAQLEVVVRILNWHALAKERTPNEFFVAALSPRN